PKASACRSVAQTPCSSACPDAPPTSPTSAALPGAADAGGTRWTSSSVMTEGCRLGRIAASVEQPEKLPCEADVFGRAQDVVVEGEPAEPRLEVRPECLGGFFWCPDLDVWASLGHHPFEHFGLVPFVRRQQDRARHSPLYRRRVAADRLTVPLEDLRLASGPPTRAGTNASCRRVSRRSSASAALPHRR